MLNRTTTRRVAFTIAAGAIALGALFAASPQARAATQDWLARLAGMNFVIGTSPTPAELSKAAAEATAAPHTSLTHEAAQAQGAKLPSALPPGYTEAGASVSTRPTGDGREFTISWKNGAGHQLDLTVMAFQVPGVTNQTSDLTMVMPEGNAREVKLKNRTVAVVKIAKNGASEPTMVQWQDGNSLYVLSNPSGDLSEEELLAVADSVP